MKRSSALKVNPMAAKRGALLPGLFNETLTPGLAASRAMRPALYVDVDSDLFVSAYQALDWLFTQRLAVRGTIVGYDDYWVLPCAKRQPHPERFGEGKAHAQIARKHGVRFLATKGNAYPKSKSTGLKNQIPCSTHYRLRSKQKSKSKW